MYWPTGGPGGALPAGNAVRDTLVWNGANWVSIQGRAFLLIWDVPVYSAILRNLYAGRLGSHAVFGGLSVTSPGYNFYQLPFAAHLSGLQLRQFGGVTLAPVACDLRTTLDTVSIAAFVHPAGGAQIVDVALNLIVPANTNFCIRHNDPGQVGAITTGTTFTLFGERTG